MTEAKLSAIPEWDLLDRLAKALRHSGVSKEEIAAYMGVSSNTVGNYLRGREGGGTDISRGYVTLWAQRTGVDLDWLRDGVSGPGHGQQGTSGNDPVETEPVEPDAGKDSSDHSGGVRQPAGRGRARSSTSETTKGSDSGGARQ